MELRSRQGRRRDLSSQHGRVSLKESQRTSDHSSRRKHDPVFRCELDWMSAHDRLRQRFVVRWPNLTNDADSLYHEHNVHDFFIADPADERLEQETA